MDGQSRQVKRSIEACIGFLLGRQSDDGSWTDWNLPPGRSSTWTTAYVGVRLAELPPILGTPALPARRSAARWLLQQELEGGGWGYDQRVGCDCDSTAHALQFLGLEGVPLAEATYDRLLAFQRRDGGFSTYPSDAGLGSWGCSHPDVSPVAAQAVVMRYGFDTPAAERTLRYVVEGRSPNGLWDSFWWDSPLYATRASLAFLRATGSHGDLTVLWEALRQVEPRNSFER